jgi:small subunit ribosomal protein S16
MSVKIRLKRMGKKDCPFYRLVVVDSRWRRDGKSIEDIGWYDPVKTPAQVKIKEDKVFYWLSKGAQLSGTARSLLKQEGLWSKWQSGEYKDELAKTDVLKNAPVTSSAVPSMEAAPVEEAPAATPTVDEAGSAE